MWGVIITGAAALLPSFLLLRYFITSDRFPEPAGVLKWAFFYGVLVTLPIVLLETLVEGVFANLGGQVTQALVMSFLVAGLCEELCKLFVLHFYCGRQSAFDEPMDGLVYGAVVSLGFATLENVLYVASGGLAVAASRALTAVPAHACFGAFMGDYYARRRFGGPGGHRPAASLVLLVPLTLHGLYDAPLFLLNVPSIGDNGLFATLLVLAFVALLGWMFQRTRRMVARLRARQDATAREELAAAARTLPPARPRD